MNILLTGGLGVNGAWVTRKLVERGLSTSCAGKPCRHVFDWRRNRGKIEIVEADITELDALVRIFADA